MGNTPVTDRLGGCVMDWVYDEMVMVGEDGGTYDLDILQERMCVVINESIDEWIRQGVFGSEDGKLSWVMKMNGVKLDLQPDWSDAEGEESEEETFGGETSDDD